MVWKPAWTKEKRSFKRSCCRLPWQDLTTLDVGIPASRSSESLGDSERCGRGASRAALENGGPVLVSAAVRSSTTRCSSAMVTSRCSRTFERSATFLVCSARASSTAAKASLALSPSAFAFAACECATQKRAQADHVHGRARFVSGGAGPARASGGSHKDTWWNKWHLLHASLGHGLRFEFSGFSLADIRLPLLLFLGEPLQSSLQLPS